MGNCLITKLKASVSNSDLPILETMQQFTLDAITASGNNSMTDAQKWALNHYFYQMGAIEDNSLWSKVRMLFIPIIGVDASTIVKDYKNSGVKIGASPYLVDQAGALEVQIEGLNNTIISTNLPNVTTNLKSSAILVTSAIDDTLDSSTGFHFRTDNKYRRVGIVSSPGILNVELNDGTTGGSRRFDRNGLTSVLGNFKTTEVDAYGIYDGSVISPTESSYGYYNNVDGSVSNAVVSIKVYTGVKYGILVDFNASLTDEECIKVINSANDLRNAFMTE